MRIATSIRLLVVGCAATVLLLAGDVLQRLDGLVPDALAQASASRLKLKFTQGSDGSKLYDPSVMYDSELGVDCAFALAADGKTRCLPTGTATAASVIRYQDSKCMQPLVSYDRGTPPIGCPFGPLPQYVLVSDEYPVGCAERGIHVYPLGAASGAAATFLINAAGTCQGNSSLGPNTWSIGAELPASSFVEGKPGTDP